MTMQQTETAVDYSGYEFLNVERRDDGVVLVVLDRPEVLNACDAQGHGEMGRIWADIDRDPLAKVALVTGAGKAFCAGGDLGKSDISNAASVQETLEHDAAIVHGMVRSRKPIVSAINGVAVGAGLAVALLADISIASDRARLIDGHTKLGVVAGDHAALIWPLLIGMARAKYYLLLCEGIRGEEAAQMGMVSRCVPHDELMDTALDVAQRLAAGSQWAIRGTKEVMNGWLTEKLPIFDHSLALEFASFFLSDAPEGIAAFREKRAPRFPSTEASQDLSR
jgi:enoyl-CoA hydratase